MDSPYEVQDYVRAYLGDTPEAKDFAKQFVDRRAKQNTNQHKLAPPPQPQPLRQQQVSRLNPPPLGPGWAGPGRWSALIAPAPGSDPSVVTLIFGYALL